MRASAPPPLERGVPSATRRRPRYARGMNAPSHAIAPGGGRLPRLLALATCLLAPACGGAEPDPAADDVLRDQAAAHAELTLWDRARAALAPLVARDEATFDDLVRAAAVEFADNQPQAAALLLERAAALDGDAPALHFLRGQMAYEAGRAPQAVEHFRAALAGAPDDLPSRLMLGAVLHELGELEQAERHYRVLVGLGFEQAGAWYLSALYRLGRLLHEARRDDQAQPFDELWAELQARGLKAPGPTQLRLGTFGRLVPPSPAGSATAPRPAPPAFAAEALALPLVARALELRAHDLDGDRRADVVALLPDGIAVALRGTAGWVEELVAGDGPPGTVAAGDLDGDGDLELVDGRGRIFARAEGGWRRLDVPVPVLPPETGPARDVLALDFDHDGDLDLLLVGAFGARLWRNDGALVPGGELADATAETGCLPGAVGYEWCAAEDLDADGDVDLLLGGPAGTLLLDSLRRGRFSDESARLPQAGSARSRPILADLDADARTDAWFPGDSGGLLLGRDAAPYAAAASALTVRAGAAALDLDLDGALDLVWDGGALLAAGLPQQRETTLAGWPAGQARALCFADLDDDGDADALRVDVGAVALLRQIDAGARGVRVALRGRKDNGRGVGAVLELRAGPIYRRTYCRGEPLLFGLGSRTRIDVLRVRWPNGVVHSLVGHELCDDPATRRIEIEQVEGLIGSCPFLYAWNGTTYGFVSDVLGITPLGLSMAPGLLVPPDHDEYVLVRGDQLVAKDGRLELQLTEELREVTYLDRARLDVVDHPAGVEIQPNERFTFPPFPEAHTHSLRAPLAPLRASGSDGRDWTAELSAMDDVHAVPFEREAPQFQGLARPWWLELEFDGEAVARAEKLRLVLTGWLYWTDASVNVAAARHPGVEFVPPILQVPDGAGGWRDAGPPVGFPAGKTKTMVLDVEALGLREDARLRVFCTLQLYWDRVVLAVDGDDAELRTTPLEPVAAVLWERGFSAPLVCAGGELPERFDWDRLARHAQWDQHPGMYTRFGDCLELVGAIDDRFVILGSGDALALAFDARELPPLREGHVRDYLLFLDGWAKDRDPNTLEALEVEPLPFHGMSGYPYGPGERFPAGEAHQDWRREWNTRPARRWIEALAPDVAAGAAAGGEAAAGVGVADPVPSERPGPLPPELRSAFGLLSAGRFEQARARARDYATRHPDDARAPFLIGASWRRTGNFEPARAAFERALELDPGFSDARRYLGQCLFMLGDLDGARREYEACRRADPDEPQGHYGSGLVALEQGRLDAAEDDFRRALGSFEALAARDARLHRARLPELADVHARLADVLFQRDDYAGARDELLLATTICPQNISAFHALGLVHRRLGQDELADAALARYEAARRAILDGLASEKE